MKRKGPHQKWFDSCVWSKDMIPGAPEGMAWKLRPGQEFRAGEPIKLLFDAVPKKRRAK